MKENNANYKAIETIATLAFICVVSGLILRYQLLFYIALCFLSVGLFLKRLSFKIAQIWLKFANLLGKINTAVILALIFFLILTPVAFFYRILHGDFMNIKRKKKTTYWIKREHKYTLLDFEKTW